MPGWCLRHLCDNGRFRYRDDIVRCPGGSENVRCVVVYNDLLAVLGQSDDIADTNMCGLNLR